MKVVAVLVLALLGAAAAEKYLSESFGAGWEDRWVHSEAKGDEGAKFKWSAGKFFNDEEADKGIQTSTDARFYGISGKFDKEFDNKDKKMIIQFTVKHEQNIDCGGGYVKLFNELEQAQMEGETPYTVMFGPDICGPGTKKVHVIFAYKGKNLQTKKNIACKSDELTHLYTLIVNPDNTYQVNIDGEKVESGSLFEDFDFLEPKMINDPEQSKPADWVDEKTIADPEDKKPEDWDKPENIADPEAEKPEDWDDDMDGEWEPPLIPNPEYKGEWKPKQIENPEYKGEWEHPQIANPDFVDDQLVYHSVNNFLGFDLWQVKSGTIFDNVLITDDEAEAEAAVEAFKTQAAGEKAAKEKADAEEKAKKEAEEAAKKAAEEAAAEDETNDEDVEDMDEVKKDEL